MIAGKKHRISHHTCDHAAGMKGVMLIFILVLFSAGPLMSQTDTEFWFVAPDITSGHSTGGEPIYLKITTQSLPATVRINQPANVYNAATNPTGFTEIVIPDLPANSVHVVDLTPWIDIIENRWLDIEPLNNFGLHITATNMITAYYEVGTVNNPDIFALKGNNALGTEFYTPFQNYYNNPDQYTPRPFSAIDIVATMDNTEVTIITNKASTLGVAGTYVINLDMGQTYSISPASFDRMAANRLDGTKITSDNPIAVTIKDDSVAADPHDTCRDLIGDQLIPVDITGTEYIIMKGRLTIPEFAYILATEDNTEVFVNGISVDLLDEGETYRYEITDAEPFIHIETTFKSYVLHVAGFGCEMGGGILPPVDVCTGSTQVGFTRSKDESFFLNIMVRAGAEDGFLFNGAPHAMLDPGIFVAVPGTTDWLAANIGTIVSGIIPVGVASMISNTKDVFHLGIINGGASTGTMYGYFSDFNELAVRANVAGTNSSVLRTCFGVPVQLFASGGVNYQWDPHTFLDDPFSPTPWANPLTSTLYEVSVSGACNMTEVATISVQVSTPVEAAFSFDNASVCAPEVVTFHNQSAGGENFRWYIDNVLVETTVSPDDYSHTFTNTTGAPELHTIELRVRNADGCSDFVTRTITVYPEIESDFSAIPLSGCDPLDVVFTNSSSGNTDKWYWDFGDGTSSSLENPGHTFTNRDNPDDTTYRVSMVAISPFHCRDTSYTDITVSPFIEAGFSFDQPEGCAPMELHVTNESTGADNNYWDFGDGNTLETSDKNIVHIYENLTGSSQTYTVRLRVTNEEGCEDILERQVTVHPMVSAGFTATPENGCSPHSVTFANSSTGAVGYLWDFGDGTGSDEINPSHLYPVNMTAGDTVYTVTLTARSAEGCTDTAQIDITVHPFIEASFTIDNTIGCHPLTVDINNNSTGADTYRWDFGDGTPVSVTGDPSFSHTYRNTGTADIVYVLELTVENDQGCKDVITRDILVYPELTANFVPTPDNPDICEPLSVFFDGTWSVNAAQWSWDFGDGTGSDLPSPSHVFTNPGSADAVRNVTLTTTSANGQCTATNSWNITVHGRVTADFEIPGDTGCNEYELDLINRSVGGTNFIWDFGDGETLATTSPDPFTHTFVNNSFTTTRQFDVTLIAENDALCRSEITKTINVYPDIEAAFTPSDTTGCHPLTVEFTNESSGDSHSSWDFGDGSFSTQENPVHVFTNTGTTDSIYRVMLTSVAGNNVCSDTSYIDIVVHPYVKAEFSMPETIDCNPFDVEFVNNSVGATSFHWDFGDGGDTITTDMNPFTRRFNNDSFISPAGYTVTMRAENTAGCNDEISRELTVHPGIEAYFEPSTDEGCQPLSIDFENLSRGGGSYSWDFGDGSSQSVDDPHHTFTNTGTTDSIYRVTLHVTSPNNICTDSYFVDITVHPYVRAGFTIPENISCTPFDLEITNSSVGAVKYKWDFGDGSDTVTFDTSPFIHRFINPLPAVRAEFPVTLIAENSSGCTDIIQKTVKVNPAIESIFEASVTEGCHPLSVQFTNSTAGAARHEWDFGDGVTYSGVSPGHTFTNTGSSPVTRTITLYSFSETHCTSQHSIEITIHPNPRAGFAIENAITCPPFDLMIENTSIDADHYLWEFGDGENYRADSDAIFQHTYDNYEATIKTYNLKLFAYSEFGCSDSTRQQVSVYPRVKAGFSSVTSGCSPLGVTFENQTTGAVNYKWDFGDGAGIGAIDPMHIYYNNSINDTTYFATLIGVSEYGCSDTSGYGIEVFPQPVAEFSVSPVYQEYPSVNVMIENESKEGLWQYNWSFDDGNVSDLRDPGEYQFGDWGEYTIRLMVNSDNCSDSSSHRIFIKPPRPVASFERPDPACVPYSLRFTNTSVYGHSYFWDFDDGHTSNEIEPIHTFLKPGIYDVKLVVTGDGGEHHTYREIEVFRKPVVNFRVVPDTVLLPDQTARLYNLSEHGARYEWDFGDGNYSSEKEPEHLYTRLGVYDVSLRVWTVDECTDIMYKERAVTVTGAGELIFPNAFRPDPSGPSDGYFDPADPTSNSVFRPYWEGITKYRLRIYNRWGEFLFESTDVLRGWDGYYNGVLSKQDVYVWKVWASFTDGSTLVKAGDVTLVR